MGASHEKQIRASNSTHNPRSRNKTFVLHSWIFPPSNPARSRFCLRSLTACTRTASKITTPDSSPRLGTHRVEFVEHRHRCRPVDARIGDTYAILEPLGSLGRYVLSPSVEMRLNHHTHDRPFAPPELLANIIEYFRLVIVVLRGVAV